MKKGIILVLLISSVTFAMETENKQIEIGDAKRLISLIESFMAGTLKVVSPINDEQKTDAAVSEDVVYADYSDENIQYTTSLDEAHQELKKVLVLCNDNMRAWELFPIQKELARIPVFTHRTAVLNKLDEYGKLQIQFLRFYDFMNDKNYSIDPKLQDKINSIMNDDTLSPEHKTILFNNDIDLKDCGQKLEDLAKNRKALKKAMDEKNAQAISKACMLPMHATPFVTLNASIEQMIKDSMKEVENPLINRDCIVS